MPWRIDGMYIPIKGNQRWRKSSKPPQCKIWINILHKHIKSKPHNQNVLETSKIFFEFFLSKNEETEVINSDTYVSMSKPNRNMSSSAYRLQLKNMHTWLSKGGTIEYKYVNQKCISYTSLTQNQLKIRLYLNNHRFCQSNTHIITAKGYVKVQYSSIQEK